MTNSALVRKLPDGGYVVSRVNGGFDEDLAAFSELVEVFEYLNNELFEPEHRVTIVLTPTGTG